MTTFTISVKDESVKSALQALAARFQNLGPVLLTIGAEITARTQHRFDTITGPDGEKWKPNKPATSKAKGGKPPLTDSGALRRQIVPEVSGNSLTVTASQPYAAIHQFGGVINRPARTMKVRHETNSKGELLRSALMNGRGLIFAKKSNPQALERSFEAAAYKITIPARPFMPIHADGSLYPEEKAEILKSLNDYLMDGL